MAGASKKRKYKPYRPPSGERSYGKLFVLMFEGTKTEPQYFEIIRGWTASNDQQPAHPRPSVEVIKGGHDRSPPKLLKLMKAELHEPKLGDHEAWLVVDKDNWSYEQLAPLHAWARDHENHGFALSNPKFEYWLLLHFEEGDKVTSSKDCSNRLKKHYPRKEKEIKPSQLTRERIDKAIARAKRRDKPPCKDWPRAPGGTTVYRLVEKLLNKKQIENPDKQLIE